MIKSYCHGTRVLAYFYAICFLVLLSNVAVPRQANANESDTVYYSTHKFKITEFDRRMYLRGAPDATDADVGSRVRNLQALSDLFAMEVLMSDASDFALLPAEERDWIANYAVQLATLKRYMQFQVDRQLAATDWDAEAAELYQATSETYKLEESVSIRTLLIRSDDRSEEEALDLAHELLLQARQPDADFEELILANTEDEVARDTGGLMENIKRGETVEPFEKAAFALRVEGEFADPVTSKFGVHLIQLVRYQEPRVESFEEVKEVIIADLKVKRAAEYREGIHVEARERKPDGFIEHTDALDALMLRTSDGKLGPDQ